MNNLHYDPTEDMMPDVNTKSNHTIDDWLDEVLQKVLKAGRPRQFNWQNADNHEEATVAEAKSEITKRLIEARIEENQRYLDLITEYRNYKPKPGELTVASFGSAGASMTVSSYETAFKDRIAYLKNQANGEQS